jgi:hypothetical protein
VTTVRAVLEGACVGAFGANMTLGILFNDLNAYLVGVLCLTAAMISRSLRYFP